MIYNPSVYSINSGILKFFIHNHWKDELKGADDYELIPMLYTGFLDRNNKKIYVNDIMKNNCDELAIVKFGAWKNKEKYDDHESGIGFYIELINGNKDNFDIWHQFEIIGNIYENPNLINKWKRK